MRLLLKYLILLLLTSSSLWCGKAVGQNPNGTGKNIQIMGSRKLLFLPPPIYTHVDTGTVVVTVWVNKKGFVKRTVVDTRKTTTHSKVLYENSIQAAKKAKFEKIEKDTISTEQITYRFKK